MSSPTLQQAQPAEVLDCIESFIREYLVCDDHQLTILTLWASYTWCFPSFLTAPYLDIRSPEPQSGKSVCLLLLDWLCRSPLLLSGAAPSPLFSRLLAGRSVTEIENGEHPNLPFTILLDDCHHSFGPSERQPLVALLNSGSDATSRFADDDDYCVYGPKAFAGNFSLPRSLASRCIPIVLRRRKASDPVKRFVPDDVETITKSFQSWLENWAEENSARLAENRNVPVQLPPALTPRQQQCAEPLIRIANLIAGPWPAKARAALSAVFGLAECSDSVQVLKDLRVLFCNNNNPEQLPTRDLLSFLCSLENRPWGSWGSKSGQRLASLLHPLGISSRDIRVGEDSLKGYRLQDLQDAWERYVGPVAEYAATEKNAATA
jgi:putative DNA primase/helicase